MTPDAKHANTILWKFPEHHGHVPLVPLLRQLAQFGVNELLIEAGPTLSGAFLREQLVDEVVIYTAPMALGCDARGMFHLGPLTEIDLAPAWRIEDVRHIGDDLRILAYPREISC